MRTRLFLIGLMLLGTGLDGVLAQSVTNPRVVTVSLDGTGAQFTNLTDALNSITDASASKPYVILVYPGIYTDHKNGDNLRWASYVSLRGLNRDTTIIRPSQQSAFGNYPIIDMTGLTGVEIRNITLDGTATYPNDDSYDTGAVQVCGAQVTVENVRYVNGNNGSVAGASFACNTTTHSSTGAGTINIRSSDLAPIYDLGNNWNIVGSYIHVTSNSRMQPPFGTLLYAYVHVPSSSAMDGRVFITGSVLETVARAGDTISDNYTVAIAGQGAGVHIVGSVIRARTEETSPAYDTVAVENQDGSVIGSGAVEIEGSTILYESPAAATSGAFYGVLAEPVNGSSLYSPVNLRGSTIRSIGSGATRSDIASNDVVDTHITVAGTEFSSLSGASAAKVTTADFGIGRFTRDLTIPLSAPVNEPVTDGRIWIDTSTNKLCYRSGGLVLCVAGTAP